MNAAERNLARLTVQPVRPFAEVFDDTWRKLQSWSRGLRLPWPITEKVGIIFEPGTLNVVAGQTSAGKTTVLLQALLHWLRTNELPIVLWSCETTHRVLMARLLAMLATEKAEGRREYSIWDVIRQAQEGRLDPEVLAAREELHTLSQRLYHLDDGALTAAEFRETCRLLAQRHGGLAAVICDYLQAMSPSAEPGRTREEEVARTTRELVLAASLSAEEGVGMTERFEVPVVAAAQLNRNISYTQDKVPQLEHLRESSRIEHSASIVIGIRNAIMSRDVGVNEELPPYGYGDELGSIDPYSAYSDLETSRELAQLAVAQLPIIAPADPQEPPQPPVLLELYVLKNRQRGHVGTVVPLGGRVPEGHGEGLRLLGEGPAHPGDGVPEKRGAVCRPASRVRQADGSQGWRIVDWLVNELHRPASENALTVAMEKERRVSRRTHVDVIVAEK